MSSSSGSTCTVGSPVLGKRVLEEEFADFKSHRRVVHRPKSEMLEALVSAKDWLTIVQDKDKDKDDESTHCFFYLQ